MHTLRFSNQIIHMEVSNDTTIMFEAYGREILESFVMLGSCLLQGLKIILDYV